MALRLLTRPEEGPNVLRVNTDSRTSIPGDLFVALPGDPGPRFNASYRSAVDGHDFVQDAAKSGAVGVQERFVWRFLGVSLRCWNH